MGNNFKRTEGKKSEGYTCPFGFLPFIIMLVIVEAFSADVEFSLKNFLYSIFFTTLLIIGIILFLFVGNKIFPYQRRVYYLDSQGITISKGKKKKHYSWDDFECFYRYSVGRGSFRTTSFPSNSTSKMIQGETFYLKMESKSFLSRFYKTFVVVYSEPDIIQKLWRSF
ncbi:hypothetical protein J7K24_00530 [bacterium]|nr:hypothetical protein [bacterium]